MEDDAARARVYPCTRLQHLTTSMPELVWKFNNVQHLQVEMVSIVCGVYTTQCVDR